MSKTMRVQKKSALKPWLEPKVNQHSQPVVRSVNIKVAENSGKMMMDKGREREMKQSEKSKKTLEMLKMSGKKGKKLENKSTVCLYYLSGRCKKTKSCPFKHDVPHGYRKPVCKLFHS